MTRDKAKVAIQTYIHDFLNQDKGFIVANEQMIDDCAEYVQRGTFSIESAARYVVEFGKQE